MIIYQAWLYFLRGRNYRPGGRPVTMCCSPSGTKWNVLTSMNLNLHTYWHIYTVTDTRTNLLGVEWLISSSHLINCFAGLLVYMRCSHRELHICCWWNKKQKFKIKLHLKDQCIHLLCVTLHKIILFLMDGQNNGGARISKQGVKNAN